MEPRNLNPPWLDRTLYPFKSRSVDINGNHVHYVDEGTGPVLLLLHGNGSYSFLYREIIQSLHSRFRCIALDWPGFGLSSARPGYVYTPREHSEVLDGFVSVLRLNAIRVMVHDWGGPRGLGFAGRRPELIHSLIIGNTWAWPAERSSPVAKFARIAGSPFGSFLIRRLNIFVRFMNPLGSSRKFSKAEKQAYSGPYPNARSRNAMAIFPKEILRSREFLASVERGLARLRDKLVLLLWGEKDFGFPESDRKHFERLFPSATTRTIPGAKHFIQEDAPEQVAQTILQFEDKSGTASTKQWRPTARRRMVSQNKTDSEDRDRYGWEPRHWSQRRAPLCGTRRLLPPTGRNRSHWWHRPE